jgi:hypothetical protein
MDDFEIKKRELLQPVLFEAGAALMDCQGFEYGVALLLFHFGRLGSPGLDPNKLADVLDDTDKKTAGQLVAMLKRHVTVSDGIDQALTEALAARNRLIHRILIENIEQVVTEDGRAALTKQIRRLRTMVQKGDSMLRPFINAFSEATDGVELARVHEEARAAFV